MTRSAMPAPPRRASATGPAPARRPPAMQRAEPAIAGRTTATLGGS